MVKASLPQEQRIFTLAHELKHHLFDQGDGHLQVEADIAEIGAEIFAVELIFPDDDYRRQLEEIGVTGGTCCGEDIVHLKHKSQATLIYKSLAKRAELLGYAE